MSKPTDPPALTHNRLLDDAELATTLGLSKPSLAAMRCRGRLPVPFVRIGGLIRYKSSDVSRYIEQNTVTPAPKPTI